MATKRSTGSQSVGAGAAAARAARPSAPKHRASVTAVETPDNAVAASSSPATTPVTDPPFDEIARLAYSYWEERGCQGGSSEEDWLRAEQELRARMTASV